MNRIRKVITRGKVKGQGRRRQEALLSDQWDEATLDRIHHKWEELRAKQIVPASGHAPEASVARKAIPAATGFVDYFPKAILAIAELSRVGGAQHHPGAPLHWDRSKSGDEADAAMRHFIDRGKLDSDGQRHSVKFAWRAMALLEKELEAALAS